MALSVPPRLQRGAIPLRDRPENGGRRGSRTPRPTEADRQISNLLRLPIRNPSGE